MRFIIPLIALGVIAAPASAAPQTDEQTVTVRIAYADIDITTAAGRATFEARVDAQLREACTVEKNARYAMGRTVLDEKCMADARAEALAEVERLATLEMRRGREVAAN